MPTTVAFNKAEIMGLKLKCRKNSPEVLIPVTAELTARLARDMEWWVLLTEEGKELLDHDWEKIELHTELGAGAVNLLMGDSVTSIPIFSASRFIAVKTEAEEGKKAKHSVSFQIRCGHAKATVEWDKYIRANISKSCTMKLSFEEQMPLPDAAAQNSKAPAKATGGIEVN